MRISAVLFGLILGVAMTSTANGADVEYVTRPAWIAAPPSRQVDTVPAPDAPVQVLFYDQQIRVGDKDVETYVAYRMKILTPAGLSAGNIQQGWNPSYERLRIHGVSIIRGSDTIDVLKSSKFRVVESDDQSDIEALSGELVARLQARDLRIGDEIEVTMSIVRHDTAFEGRVYDIAQWPIIETRGTFRFRLDWPVKAGLRWHLALGLPKPDEQTMNGRKALNLTASNLSAVDQIDGAPSRYNIRRQIQYSNFSSWSDVSNRYWQLIEPTITLKPGSALAVEVNRIAQETKDPATRARAALRLVQDQIRYVYIGLDGGHYRPADPEETWTRRFGDCKAKSVLLRALLQALDIESELVLVNSGGLDGVDQILPTPQAFNHVVVRAKIAGIAYWFDGTRFSGRELPADIVQTYRNVLPVRAGPSDIEILPSVPPSQPLTSVVANIDARAGVKTPARAEIEEVLRGDVAASIRQVLSPLGTVDAQRLVTRFFTTEASWLDVDTATWRYDERRDAIVLTAKGKAKLDVGGDLRKGGTLSVVNAGFSPPAPLKRPASQDQTLPWALPFPAYMRWTTLIHLPPAPSGRKWRYKAKPVHMEMGGQYYWRETGLSGDIFRSTMSRRTLSSEISSAIAQDMNDRLSKFDNKISHLLLGDAKVQDDGLADQDATGRVHRLQAQRHLSLALTQLLEGNLDAALAAINDAHATEPESELILRTRAEILSRLGRWEEALADLEDVLRINPLDLDAAKRAASLRKEKGLVPPIDWARPLLNANELGNVTW